MSRVPATIFLKNTLTDKFCSFIVAHRRSTGIGNQTILRLTENLIQHRYWDDFGLDDFTKHISCSYARKLIWVAYQYDSGIYLHAFKKFLSKPHIHHGKLIHND